MIDFGTTLRQAREQKGLTAKQVAEATHMMEQMVTDLENENFGRIAAPIYGRGFVKLYCEAVGLDPKPMIAEFMEILGGNRPATIRRRDTASVPAAPLSQGEVERPAPAAEAAPAPKGEPPAAPAPKGVPPVSEDPLFNFARSPAGVPAKEPAAAPRDEPRDARAEPAPEEGFARFASGPSRYAVPTPISDKPARPLFRKPAVRWPSATFWRFTLLLGASLAFLALAAFLIHALYRSLTGPSAAPAAEATPAAAVERATPAPSDEKVPSTPAPRKALAIPPLYID